MSSSLPAVVATPPQGQSRGQPITGSRSVREGRRSVLPAANASQRSLRSQGTSSLPSPARAVPTRTRSPEARVSRSRRVIHTGSPEAGASCSSRAPSAPAPAQERQTLSNVAIKGTVPLPLSSADLCPICLEPLGKDEFVFPCGSEHRLHYQCAIYFLRCILISPETRDACSPDKSILELSFSFRAIDAVEEALSNVAPAQLDKLRCPLCRGGWADHDTSKKTAPMHQLRSLSLARRRGIFENLFEVLRRSHDCYNIAHGVRRYRLGHGLRSLYLNYHSPASFFALRIAGDRMIVAILSFLRCRSVQSLSMVCCACRRLLRVGSKLRVPYLQVNHVFTATQCISAEDLISVEVDGASIKGQNRTASEISALAAWLSGGWIIKQLNVISMEWELGDCGALQISMCIRRNQLCVLDLSHNKLLDESVLLIAESLVKGPSRYSLQVLNLNLNFATERSLAALLPLGCGKGRLQNWGLKHNKLGDAGCHVLAQARPNSASWDLQTNGIGPTGCMHLMQAMQDMTELRLGNNHFDDKGMKHLSQSFGPHIVLLDFRNCQLSDEGATLIAKSLVDVSSLAILLLGKNQIGPAGALALAESWAFKTSLHHVELSSNPLGSSGVELLAECLPAWQQSPFRLSLTGIGCNVEGVLKLKAALTKYPRGTHNWRIDLQHNGLQARDVRDISNMLCMVD